MRWLLFVTLAGCASVAAPPLPAECMPTALDPATCISQNGWTACLDADGTKWVWYPDAVTSGGYEHFDNAGCTICRVWASGAYVTGQQIREQTGHACPSVNGGGPG